MKIAILLFFRNFKKQTLIYSITIGGFAISMAVLILMVAFLLEEKSVDKHLPNLTEMYRIKQVDGNAQIPQRVEQKILDAAPEIEKLCLLSANSVLCGYNGEKQTVVSVTANNAFFDVFSVPVIKGETSNLLRDKSNVVITQSFAQELFGEKNPLGETLDFGNSETKVVQAVIADPDKNSSLKYDIIFNLDQDIYRSVRGYNDESFILFNVAAKLNKGANIAEVNSKISTLLQTYAGYEKAELTTQPFKDLYFDLETHDCFKHANINMIKLLSWIALIILLLAVLNYVNLITAVNNDRYKEICIRKTSGAKNSSVMLHFVVESYLSILIAMLLGIGLAMVISPLFNELFSRAIVVLDALKNSEIRIALLTIFIVIGGVTSVIPATSVSRFNPIDLLQRNIKIKNSNFRGIYNTVQLTVSLCLIIGLFVIVKQIRFVKTKDVGFDTEFLVAVELEGDTYGKAKIIQEKLLQYPEIIDVSGTMGSPFGIYTSGSGSWNIDGEEFNISDLSGIDTDTSFLSTFGVKLMLGRNFRPTDKNVCLINEKTYKYLHFDNLENKNIWGTKIIGVVKDFNFKELHTELSFLQLKYNPDNVSKLNIKISGTNIPATLDHIKSTFKEFDPGVSFEPYFYNDWMNSMYKKEETQAKAIKIYALIALLLSCLGLLGLSKYSTVKRTKEIGIRKVNGAKVVEILTLLNKELITWVVLAYIIAIPISWYVMSKWLENFAYKTDLSWWTFAIAGAIALGIALLTVSWQSWRAATRNPVEALRYE